MLFCDMKQRFRACFTAVLCAGVSLGLVHQARAQTSSRYILHSIPILSNYPSNRALAINKFGTVTGYHESALGVKRSYRYNVHNSTSTLLNPLNGDTNCEGHGISYVGTVVGLSDYEPVRWTGSGTAATSMGGSSQSAEAINTSDKITGYRDNGSSIRAYLWSSGGGFVDIPTLGGSQGFGYDLNDNDFVCGASRITGNSADHAFLWSSGSGITDLGTLSGYTDSVGKAVNIHNQVACDAIDLSGVNDARSFLWQNGTRTNLGALPGAASISVEDINDDGVIVGECYFNGSGNRAMMWYNGVMTDLNDLIQPQGWVLRIATGINQNGEISGYGDHNGTTQGFVLIPNYSHGTIICNDTVSDRAYVLNPDTGDFLRTFDTGYSSDGIEIVDGDLDPLLPGVLMLADRSSGTIYKIYNDGTLFSTFGHVPSGQLRGIATSFARYIVGATSNGIRAWDLAGNLQSATTPGNFYDVFLLALSGPHKYYVVSDIANDDIAGYNLNLGFYGRTTPGSTDFPQQITTINSNSQYAVAVYNEGIIRKVKVTNGAVQGSFPVQGSPRGVIQLASGHLLVSTTQGVFEYTVSGTLVRQLFSGSGFQYLDKCYNFDP